IEHDLATGEIDNLGPSQRGSHTGAVHRASKKTPKIRLLCVRLKHFLASRISLGRVCLERFLELIQRTDRIIVDDEIEIRSKVCRALVEKVVLRKWSNRVLTIAKLEKAERCGGGQDCFCRSAFDSERLTHLRQRARPNGEQRKEFEFVSEKYGRESINTENHI